MPTFKYAAIPFLLLYLFGWLSLLSEAAPVYSAHYCTNRTFYEPNATFQANLNVLLTSLTSNASLHNGFYRTTMGRDQPDVVNGLFLCRGDINATVCEECVAVAAKEITRRCPNDTESIIWYDVCMLRYSNDTFDNIVPGVNLENEKNITASDHDRFNQLLASLLNNLASKALNLQSEKKFATGESKFTSSQTLYGLAQCVPDSSAALCDTCFQSAISSIPSCCDGKQGARALLPACNVRYELYPFYTSTAASAEPSVPPRSSGRSNDSIIIGTVVPISILVVLFVLGCCYLRWRQSKKYNAVLENSIRNDFTYADSLHFDLATIEAATNRFSDDKIVGQGGFGVVYKGTLPNGQEIAVKRLSRSSLQGTLEFRNEAALVALLQHRNLVRLLGFCLEGQEKILVYEYIPNGSLDRFLFDPEKQRNFNWSRRYKIIVGIARGIQYLHEDSRLKIIHRDLKANNVLLDDNMNAKISDFGMAKIFHPDQTPVCRGSTGRIVGTYGYMSPEYAMHGKFSEKSDVFSFGVLVLEIVSGKKNTDFHHSHHGDELLSFAWKHWANQTPLHLLDPTLKASYSRNEVMRCVHIALSCVQENPADRPSMATVSLMLNSYSVTLSLPRQPASLLRGRRTPNSSDQSTSSSVPLSINDASITEVYPR